MTTEAMTIPRHEKPYTVDEVLDLFAENRRVELLEGALIVSPSPRGRHQRVADKLCRRLDDVAPGSVQAATAFNVRPDPDEPTLFIPDVVVTSVDLAADDPAMLEAFQVLAVVEVVSPSSRSHDRLVKAARYAEAGIPCYWRVELDPFPGQGAAEELPVVIVHDLVGTTYREAARLAAGVVGSTDLPFPITLDPADLLR